MYVAAVYAEQYWPNTNYGSLSLRHNLYEIRCGDGVGFQNDMSELVRSVCVTLADTITGFVICIYVDNVLR